MSSTCERLKVALVPLNIVWENSDANLSAVSSIFKCIPEDTDIVVLPETFSTGFPSGESRQHVLDMAEATDGHTISLLSQLARQHNMAIAGSFIAVENEDIFNRGFFLQPNGILSFADKHHLFTMAGEHKVFSEGDHRLAVTYKGWNISLVICYDVRFPAWCRNRNNEYDLLIAVANWPSVRIDAWNKLLYARAIENLSFVCATDCKGTDMKGFEYDGSSHVIDFKGKDIGTVSGDGLYISAELSKDSLQRFRDKFPAWKDADAFILE